MTPMTPIVEVLWAHLHMAKNLSTKSRRSVGEVSAKDFSLPAKFFLPKNFTETSSTKNF